MIPEEYEWLLYTGVIIVVVGMGLYLYRKEISFLFRKAEVEGTIVNWMSATEKGKRYFYPMIEFRIEGMEKITFRSDERCENKPLYEPGTKVTIQYLPGDPDMRRVVYPAKQVI